MISPSTLREVYVAGLISLGIVMISPLNSTSCILAYNYILVYYYLLEREPEPVKKTKTG